MLKITVSSITLVVLLALANSVLLVSLSVLFSNANNLLVIRAVSLVI